MVSVPSICALCPCAAIWSSRKVSASTVPDTPPLAVTRPRSVGAVAPAIFSTRLMSGASKLKAMSARGSAES